MSKITVKLNAVMNDGAILRNPGESISMDVARAKRLAALGMVRLPSEATKAKKTDADGDDNTGGGNGGGEGGNPPGGDK